MKNCLDSYSLTIQGEGDARKYSSNGKIDITLPKNIVDKYIDKALEEFKKVDVFNHEKILPKVVSLSLSHRPFDNKPCTISCHINYGNGQYYHLVFESELWLLLTAQENNIRTEVING